LSLADGPWAPRGGLRPASRKFGQNVVNYRFF
jgi:hypothetical protein